MNKEFTDDVNIHSIDNEGDLKAHLQFLFSLFQISDMDSIPSIIENCNGNKQQLYDKLVTMILSSIHHSHYIVDESDDSLEQNSSNSLPNYGCYRFSNTNEQLSSNDNLRKDYQPKANICKLHEYLYILSTKQNCNDCSEERDEQKAHNNTDQCYSSVSIENQQLTNSNNNKTPSITKCSLPLIDSEVLTIFNRVNPEDIRRKSSASKESDETEDKDGSSIKTQTSYIDDTLETSGYSLTSYIRNNYNVFSTTSFVIDPSEKISKQGRVEIKTFLILLLHRLLIRMEEGDEHHQWQPDNTVTNCSLCNTPFSVIKRKHHCRICGRIFCSKCSNHKLMCSSSGKRERVCDICFVLYLRMPHISSM